MPAAIVSPLLRIKIRPISLFVEKGSKGMTVLRAPGPPNEACRIAICTSAEVPFVKTLVKGSITMNYHTARLKKPGTYLGFRLVTAPEARSNVTFSLDIAAGTSRD